MYVALAPSVTESVPGLKTIAGYANGTQSVKTVFWNPTACFTTRTNPPLLTIVWATLTFRVIALFETLLAIIVHLVTEEPVLCGTLAKGHT